MVASGMAASGTCLKCVVRRLRCGRFRFIPQRYSAPGHTGHIFWTESDGSITTFARRLLPNWRPPTYEIVRFRRSLKMILQGIFSDTLGLRRITCR